MTGSKKRSRSAFKVPSVSTVFSTHPAYLRHRRFLQLIDSLNNRVPRYPVCRDTSEVPPKPSAKLCVAATRLAY